MSPADQSAKEFLKSYLDNTSPSGHETSGQKIWLDYVTQFMNPETDYIADDGSYGSVAAVIKGSKDDYTVVLEAHADEISWMVQRIDDNGLIGVSTNGGSNPRVAPASRVNIHTKNGFVTGIFDTPAMHVLSYEEMGKADKAEELKVFIGSNSKEAVLKRGINVGSILTFSDGLIELGANKEYYAGRALDDKMCGYINTQVLRRLKEQNITLPYTLCIVNSVLEETGQYGASNMAKKLKPDVAIVLDVTFDTQGFGYKKEKQGDMKIDGGPTLLYGAMVHKMVNGFLENVAAKNNIPLQREAADHGEQSGTDVDAFMKESIPTALISLPLKNMHTTVETASKADIEATIQFALASLKEITGEKSQFDLYADDRAAWAKKFKNQPR